MREITGFSRVESQFKPNQTSGSYFKRPSTLVVWSLNFSLSLARLFRWKLKLNAAEAGGLYVRCEGIVVRWKLKLHAAEAGSLT